MPASSPWIALIKTRNRQGTGVRLNATLVLTCEHVVGQAEKPLVDGKPCVRVIGRDAKADLALLEVTSVADLTEGEWTEELSAGTSVRIEGYPHSQFERLTAAV